MNRTNFFFCYNKAFVDELIEYGFKYITRARNLKTNGVFTMFHLDDELQKYLASHTNNKN
ncbi:hypothetical protein MHH85_05045 [Viridibacillus sp. FSL E2-0187]|uniref:hypothetical protein n=1 Tax=Viridibacillus sp. FSL E2-0187 TaxID=2921362 RepID=UPI0030F815D8